MQFGRTYMDCPEIDGKVYVKLDKVDGKILNNFIDCKIIDKYGDYDLIGEKI